MEVKDYEKIFKALANQRRLNIIIFLSARKTATVGEIAEKIRLSIKSTSKHLSVLYASEFLDREQTSLNVNYFLRKPLSINIRKIISSFTYSPH